MGKTLLEVLSTARGPRPTPETSGGIQDSGHSFSQYGPTRPFSLKLKGILSRRIRMILGCSYGKIFHNLHEQLASKWWLK